jgi:DNA-binding MarR family transcriptional regulator
VSEIGTCLLLESNTLSPVIKKLEKLKLLNRLRDSKDERKVIISLTPKGRALKSKSKPYAKSVIEKTGLSVDEFKELQTKIVQLRKQLISS